MSEMKSTRFDELAGRIFTAIERGDVDSVSEMRADDVKTVRNRVVARRRPGGQRLV